MSSVRAIIPARAGSKRILDKNLRLLTGKTLISLGIEYALSLGINEVILTSDSDQYLDLHSHYPVTMHKRSSVAACDAATDIDVVVDLVSGISVDRDDIWVWLRPTSPYRKVEDCIAALTRFRKDSTFNSMRTVQKTKVHPYWMKTLNTKSLELAPAIEGCSEASYPRSQLLPPYYEPTCQFELFYPSRSITSGLLLPQPMMGYETSGPFVDIDTVTDLEYALYLSKTYAEPFY